MCFSPATAVTQGWCGRAVSSSGDQRIRGADGYNYEGGEEGAADDGLVGQQLFAGEATRLASGTEEAQEGRDAFVEKRERDFSRLTWHY